MDKIHRTGNTIAWPKSYALVGGLVILFIALAVPFVTRQDSEWNIVYILAANHLRAGDHIYHVGEGYVYPPFMALLAVPFTYLPRNASLLAWYLVNVGAILILVRYAWKLARVDGDSGHLRNRLAMLLGIACGIRYISDGLSHQQTDIVIGAVLMFGCWSLMKTHSWIAAISFGIAAGAKCTPLLFAGYLLWRRQWKQAVALVAVAVGVNLLADVLFPPREGSPHLTRWVETHLAPMATAEKYPYSEQLYNQSLAGAVNRWLTTQMEWTDSGVTIASRDSSIAPVARKIGVYFVELLLLVATFGLFARTADPGSRTPWELSAVLLLMVLLSPMSSKPHFCTLVLPGMCIALRMLEDRDAWLGGLLISAILVGLLGGRGIVGKELSTLAMWYGHVMWSTLMLLAACGCGLMHAPHAQKVRVYPLMTPMGRMRATLRERPARSTTSTTSSTFL